MKVASLTWKIRFSSGVVLFFYITQHLLNHALGLWSLGLAEAALEFSVRLWQSLVGTTLLYGSAAVHITLALQTLFSRQHWRLGPLDAVRLAAGFSLPVLLIGHAVATRVAYESYGLDPTYRRIVSSLVATGSEGWQLALLAPGWVHGSLGLLFRMGHRISPTTKSVVICVMILIPVLSATGFARMADTLQVLRDAPAPLDAAQQAALATLRQTLLFTYIGLLIGAIALGRVWHRFVKPARL
jgi:adenylate cyclase